MKQYLPMMLGVGAAVVGGFVLMRVIRSRSTESWLDDDSTTGDGVDLASDQSFPASDPPSWTGTTAAPIR